MTYPTQMPALCDCPGRHHWTCPTHTPGTRAVTVGCLCSHPPSLHHAHQGICWGHGCGCVCFEPDDGKPIPESSINPGTHENRYNGQYANRTWEVA